MARGARGDHAVVNLLFLAAAAGYSLWKFTTHDKVKSDLQHEMALNIGLEVESVRHAGGRFVRVTAPVQNVSTNKFGIPQVCFTVSLVPLSGLRSHASWQLSVGSERLRLGLSPELDDKVYERVVTRNINAYPNMPTVKPQERESFTDWLYFDEEDISTHPTVVIQVDVVGVMVQKSFVTKEARAKFMEWMRDNGGDQELLFKSWKPDEVNEIKEARRTGRDWKGQIPNRFSLERCLNSKPTGTDRCNRDYAKSAEWGDVLEDSVLWDRYAIVSLVDGRVLAVGPGAAPSGEMVAATEPRPAAH